MADTSILPSPLINNLAHIYTDSLISDTILWTRISGSFIADSAYQYMMIGNFFDDNQIDSILISGSRCIAYYYIDDVCVSTDSITCGWKVILKTNVSSSNISCFGLSDGSATISVISGVPPYHYQWSNGDTTNVISNLPAGIYSFTITDAHNNAITDTILISEPTELITSTSITSQVTCYGDSNGAAKIIASGGTPPFNFFWNDGQTTDSPTGFSAGTFYVTVTDSNGCTTTTSIIFQDGTLVEAGEIIGTDSALVNQSAIYRVEYDSSYNYTWNVISGSIISGQNTNTIEVIWDSVDAGFIQLITTVQGCSDTTSKSLTLLSPTIVNDNTWNIIEVYPNPAKDFIFITQSNASSQITLLNILGQEEHILKQESKPIAVSISGLSAGIYFLKLQTQEAFQVLNILIQK